MVRSWTPAQGSQGTRQGTSQGTVVQRTTQGTTWSGTNGSRVVAGPSSAGTRQSAAMGRLQTWSQQRQAYPTVGSTTSVPGTTHTGQYSRRGGTFGTRVPQGTTWSSGGDTAGASAGTSSAVVSRSDGASRMRSSYGSRSMGTRSMGTQTLGTRGTAQGATQAGTTQAAGNAGNVTYYRAGGRTFGVRSVGGRSGTSGTAALGTGSAGTRSAGTRSAVTRSSGTTGAAGDTRDLANAGRVVSRGERGSVRSGEGRAGLRSDGTRTGGARHAAGGSARAGVRYEGGHHDDGYGPHDYYHHGHGYYYDWYGHSYWGYPCRWWGAGLFFAFWDPWYYDAYSPFWVGGAPAFGFGTVYYGPAYSGYFAEPVVIEQPVYVETPVYVQGAPVEEGVPAPAAAPAPAVAPAPAAAPATTEEADVPGRADFEAGVQAFLGGDYPEALRRFRLVVQADDQNGEGWMAVGQAAFAVGAYDEAGVAIAQAANLGAFPRGYRYDPKPMYPQDGRFDELFGKLQAFRQAHPEDANAHIVAAYFHVALGESAEANGAILATLKARADDKTAPILSLALLPPLPPEKSTEGGAGSAAAPAPLPAPATR